MDEPKISVIIPVYNVEQYIKKCLDSVIAQTYRSLEIILVDNGSTDKSAAICDEYAEKDKRIRVIHKAHEYASDARNAGLAAATGEWIAWVDSDDWTEPDMFEYLINAAVKEHADIVVCGRYEWSRGKSVFRGWEKACELNTESALEQLLKNQTMQNSLWDKLWRKELFDGIEFPTGRTFEDFMVSYRLFERAEKVVCLPEAKYHYLKRAGSVTDDVSLEKRINHYDAAKARYNDMIERWPQFSLYLEGQCTAFAVSVWCVYLKNKRAERKKYRAEIKEMAQFSKHHYKAALRYVGLGRMGKIVARLTPHAGWWAFMLSYLCGRIYKLKHGREM